ncbi:MAG: serine/threonine protein kinase [Planctomycetes bacterium]|nr:serine/threonine protein kinase [Planctomycetota bacterium]
MSLGPPPSNTPPPAPKPRVSPLPPRPEQGTPSTRAAQIAAQQRAAAAQRSAASSQNPAAQPNARSAQSSQNAAAQRSSQSSQSAAAQQRARSAQSSQQRPGQPPVGEQTEVPRPVTPMSPEEMNFRAQQDPSLADTQDMDPVEIEKPPENVGNQARISFGQAAVNLKLVTAAQIQECVNVQRALLAKGQRVPLLGQILAQRGYLDKPGVEKIKSYQLMYQMQDKIPGYQLAEKLGQGAMGTVYKAKQVRMDRFVAIKVLQPELAANSTIKQRFLQEARASARLNHPNVITGIDAGEIEGLCYFAMEYVEGKTLQQLVKERGAMDERQALDAILQVAKALEHAEKLSLVHRDVKPDNIMITRDRQVKLLDLGLAKVRAAEDVGSTKGMAVGTPNYISPEQAMGRQDIDTRSDIYSLGVTLYFMLTAKVPFEGPPEVVMYRHIHEPPPHPKNFRPDLQDSTATLIFTMMSKRPEDRPASAGQLVSDIEHLMKTGKLPGFFDGPPPPGGLKVKRDSGILVNQKRAPRLKGYGMPATQPPAPANPPPAAPGGAPGGPTRMPRKRKKRFGGSW